MGLFPSGIPAPPPPQERGQHAGRAVLDFSNDVFIQRGEIEAEGFQNRLDVDDESPRDRWAFLALAARTFIYLGDDRRELKLAPIDIDKSMPASKLLIRSAPPQCAIKGQKWSYDLLTNPQGNIQVKLDSAPENMTVVTLGPAPLNVD